MKNTMAEALKFLRANWRPCTLLTAVVLNPALATLGYLIWVDGVLVGQSRISDLLEKLGADPALVTAVRNRNIVF